MTNISNIEWHYVVPFAPEGASNNVSSYLYWTLELSSISVSPNQYSSGPAVDWPHAGKRHRHHSEAHIPINYPRYRLSCASRHVRIFRSPIMIATKFSRNLFCRGTPGMYGPYDDVSNIYSLIPGSRLVDPSKCAFRA